MNQNLPKLADLHKNPQEAFKNDQFKTLLNQPPHASWLKKHPMAKRKVNGQTQAAEYIPIDKIEFLLDIIFQEWKVEVLSSQVMLNSIAVTIRLHYKNPVTGEWSFHDGVGAKSVQVDQGAHPSNLAAIKDAAVQMALPSAKSYAVKDAAEHLGDLFGRNINREDTLMFTGRYGEEVQEEPQPVTQSQMPWQPVQRPAQPQPKQSALQFNAEAFFSNL